MAIDERVASWPDGQPDVDSRQGVTARSIVLGVALALLTIVWNTYVEYIAHTARINITHFPIAIFVPYVVLTLGNAVLRRFDVAWALSGPELLAMLAMGLVGAAVPAYGLTSYFLGMISIPYYLATPENQWANFFHQYLPTWLIPSNEGGAMQYLFEGLPSPDMPIPWGMWIGPLAGWMLFIGAIVVASLCLAVMLRKQWAEHERLAYPILHPAEDLSEAEARVPLFENKLFWFGVAIPFLYFSWNMISYFSPGFPRISLSRGWMPIGMYFPHIHVSINFYTIGFAYFANVDVLFSIWLFYLFYCAQAFAMPVNHIANPRGVHKRRHENAFPLRRQRIGHPQRRLRRRIKHIGAAKHKWQNPVPAHRHAVIHHARLGNHPCNAQIGNEQPQRKHNGYRPGNPYRIQPAHDKHHARKKPKCAEAIRQQFLTVIHGMRWLKRL